MVKEPSGTVSPLALRTRILSTSATSLPVLVARLRGDAEGAAEQIEVVDVGRADIDLQRVEHVLHVDAEQLRLGAVDVEIDLRRRGLEQREDLGDAWRLRGARHHRRGRLLQRRRAAAGAVLDHHAEAAGIADAAHRRRQHRDDEGLLDLGQPAIELRLDRRAPTGADPAARFVERIEHQEDRAGIGRIGEGGAGKADDVDAMGDAGHAERDVERALLHRVGARQRGAGRQAAPRR